MQPTIPGLESFMPAGMSGGAGNYDPRIRQLLESGVDPRLIRGLGKEGASKAAKGVQGAQQFLGTFTSGLSTMPAGRLGVVGGLVAPAMTAVEEAQAGRPVGALGALGGGAAGALGGAALGRVALGGLAATPGIPGLIGKVGQAALPVLGGMLGSPAGAQVAESTRQKVTGEPTKGKEGEFKTQLAMAGQINELGATQYRNQLGTYTSAIRDLQGAISDQQYLDLQRNIPLIEKMKNNELIRNQTLLNTQGQLQSQLGVLATAGALAQGAQAQTGETLRTALTSNPYAGSVLQAPQIRFG